MKYRFSAILAAGLVLAACSSQAPSPRTVEYNQPEGTVKLISYNIRQSGMPEKDGPHAWPHRKEATLNMIQQEAPSVIGFQELLPAQQDYVRAAFPQYGFVGVGRDNGEKEGECMGVMYLSDVYELLDSKTFWLSETPEEVSMGWDAACHRTVTCVNLQEKSSGKDFWYFNTHLDHIGMVAREESVKLLVNLVETLVPEGKPVIVGGDLNSGIESSIFKPFEQALLLPARNISPKTSYDGTFNAFGTAPSGIVLDHFFARDVTPIEFETLTKDYGAPIISDHYPVVFIFSLN